MPTVRSYVVTQERQVRVVAQDPTHAVNLAEDIFKGEGPPLPEVRVTEILAREDF